MGVQNKFEQKSRAVKTTYYFVSMTSVRITFLSPARRGRGIFFKWEAKAGWGDDPGQLKKIRQGGHVGGFNKYLF